MKRWLAILLTLATTAALPACTEAPPEPPGGAAGEPPANLAGAGNGASEAAGGDSRYILVGGSLVGSWEDGAWVSAGGDRPDRAFSLGEILGEDGFYVYEQEGWELPRENYLMQCEIHTHNDGVGGLLERDADTRGLLDPLAAFVPAGEERRTFALPTALTGEAGELLVPAYSFSFAFGGRTPALAVSQRIEAPDSRWDTWEPGQSDDLLAEERALAESYLRGRGYTGEFTMEVIEISRGSGTADCYLFLDSARDEGNYWTGGPEDGGFFSFVLCRRADGTLEEVYEETVSYEAFRADSVTLFAVEPVGVWDLNGDGTEEVCLRDRHWEWGWYDVLERQEDGTWEIVLQMEY